MFYNSKLSQVVTIVPGHCGILGNDRAHELAKKGTTIELITQQEVHYNSRKTNLKRNLREVHQKDVLTSEHCGILGNDRTDVLAKKE